MSAAAQETTLFVPELVEEETVSTAVSDVENIEAEESSTIEAEETDSNEKEAPPLPISEEDLAEIEEGDGLHDDPLEDDEEDSLKHLGIPTSDEEH